MTYKLERLTTSNQSSRQSYGNESGAVKGITIHHWGADRQRHDAVVSWLRGKAAGSSNNGSSAHYVVSAGRVTQLADDTRATWHSGNRRGNGETIGIEMRPEMSQGDWNTLVQLCADIEKRHGSLRYYLHSDWKATACPGRYAPRLGELVAAVNKLAATRAKSSSSNSSNGSSSSSSSAAKSVGTMAAEVIAGKHGTGHAARRRSLNISAPLYEKVRAEVNRRAGLTVQAKSVGTMAAEVIAGKHGTGHAARRRSLNISAPLYEKVRAEVNRRLR